MAQDTLTSQAWNDIIFEGKNKDYGAYDMRQTSSNRHVIAFLLGIVIVIFVSFLPSMIEKVKEARGVADGLTDDTVLADLQKELEDQVQEKDIIREETAPPPPPLKSTIQFTAPEIVSAEDIKDDEEMKSQDDLQDSKVQISVATVDGTDDEHGIDIADLQEHKVIAEAVDDNKVYDFVEQSPEFPGGVAAMRKFLSDNIQYPSIAQENGIQGKVTLKFVVNKLGVVSEVQIGRAHV